MSSATVETLCCPLDLDLLKSWEKFSLESSCSFISSDNSESVDGEIDNKHDTLTQQLNSLTFDDVSDSENVSLRCSSKCNKINNAQVEDNSEDLISFDDKENEENKSSHLSLKNEDKLEWSKDTDNKNAFSEFSNKNCKINSEKKNKAEKFIFLDNSKIEQNHFLLKCKNNKSSYNVSKSSSDASAEDESDSDNGEKDESVTLRERYPDRHNRLQNNKQQRTIPFPVGGHVKGLFTVREANKQNSYTNCSQTSTNYVKELFTVREANKQNLYSNGSQTSTNYSSTWSNINVPHDGYAYLDQNICISSEGNNRTLPSHVLNSELMVNETLACDVPGARTDNSVNGFFPRDIMHQIFTGVIPSDTTDLLEGNQIVRGVIPFNNEDQTVHSITSWNVTDQIANNVFPCVVSDQTVNDVIPCSDRDQITNGVIPYSVGDEVFDRVVPSGNDFGYLKDTILAELNDVFHISNLEVKSFPESINNDCVNTGEDKFLDSYFEDLTPDVLDHIKEELKSISFPSKNDFNYIKNKDVATTSKEISSKNNNYYFNKEYEGLHSSFSNTVEEENSGNSNLVENNGIFGKPRELCNSEYSANKSGNYSNMVSNNFTSKNSEDSSAGTSDYHNISKEIETFISRNHEILHREEMKDRVMKGTKNITELSPSVNDRSWHELPFVEQDSNSFSKCVNTSKCQLSRKKNGSRKREKKERRDESEHLKSSYITEERKICSIWKTAARDKLFYSSEFSIEKWEIENKKLRQKIQNGELGTDKKKVIHFLKRHRTTKYKGTNLHFAIQSGNKEKVFCIVELHKEFHGTTFEINFRDSCTKEGESTVSQTVLDNAKKKGMKLLADYLEENDAKENICV